MAPVPRPKAINDLRGDPGFRRRNEVEPTPPALDGIPTAPDHLNAIGKKEWGEICQNLQSMNLLSKVDTKAIEQYCISYSRWREALAHIQTEGEVIFDPKKERPIKSPWSEVLNSCQEQMRKSLIEWGMTPAARARMRIPIEKKKPDSKWASLKIAK